MKSVKNQSGSTPSADKFTGKGASVRTTKGPKNSGEVKKPTKNGSK